MEFLWTVGLTIVSSIHKSTTIYEPAYISNQVHHTTFSTIYDPTTTIPTEYLQVHEQLEINTMATSKYLEIQIMQLATITSMAQE